MLRPTHKELSNKIREAKKAVSKKAISVIKPDVIASDALELGYHFENDLLKVIKSLLDEISPGNYAGSKPPQKSYEDEIKDTDLFAFNVESSWFGCGIYLKFTVFDDKFWLVSLHKNREERNIT